MPILSFPTLKLLSNSCMDVEQSTDTSPYKLQDFQKVWIFCININVLACFPR